MRQLLMLWLVSMLLTACGGAGGAGGDGGGTPGLTQVTINLGQTVAAGAVSTTVPLNIQSMRVTVYNASGTLVAGPATATAPTLSVTLTVPNGSGFLFRVLAFSAAGQELYRGETTANLNGGNITLPIQMNLTTVIAPAQASVQRGQQLNLTGTVAGLTPSTPTSSLRWQASAGQLTQLDVYGAAVSWIAPNVPGVVTIDAYVQNPSQNPAFYGHSVVTVVNQPPLAVDDYAATRGAAPVIVNVLANDRDPENDAIRLVSATQGGKGTTVINTAAGTISYTANAGAAGQDRFTYTITDAFGAQATATVFVTLNDTQPPVFTIVPQAITVEASSGTGVPASNAVIQTFLNAASATDNIALATLTNNAPVQFPLGTTQVIFTATDTAGNQATATSSVTVQDTTPPTLTLPANVYAEATGVQTTVVVGTATASDIVDGALIPASNAPASFPLGTTTVTWTVTDAAGNTATGRQLVVISDTTAPTLNIPADVYVEATSPLTNVAIGTATASDLVSGVLNPTNNAPAAYPVGTTPVTWTVSDAYGNTAMATQLIHVQDTTAPTLNIPADVYAEATGAQTAVVLGTATASDLVSGTLTPTNNAPATFPVGTTLVTWNVSDAYGNTATATQRVIISDTTPPALTLPADVYVEATGVQTAVTIGTASATDLVFGAVTPTNNAPATFPVGITPVTWTATDGYGNTTTGVQNIVVQDTTPPTVTAPANITVAAVNAAGTPATDAAIATFLTGATASDLVSGNVPPTNNAPATFPLGVTTVTFSATDAQGNTGTATATVTVVDQTAPVVTPPANITVAAVDAYGTPATDPYIAAFLNGATATDNVDGAIAPTNNAPAQFPIGATLVTFTAVDAYGNTGTATATVTVQNQTAPTVTPPANITVAAVNAAGTPATDPYITAFLGGATAVDVFGNPLPVTNNGPAQFPFGTTTVTFSATDAQGNTGTATATVTISDQTAPIVTAPAAIVVAAVDAYGTPATDPYITAFLGAGTATDNVNPNPPVTNNAPAQLPLGVTTVVFSANDGYGNIGTATSTITVHDLTPPVVTAPADVYQEAVAMLTPVTLGAAMVTDNVDIGLIATASNTGPFPVGITQVIWSATDAYGNVGTAVQRVVVSDTTAPTLTLPADVYVEATGAQSAVNIGAATANDLVFGPVTPTNNAPATFPVGTTPVTWTAVDGYGNTATGIQNITVQDTTPPTVASPANIVLLTQDAYGLPASDPYIQAFLNGATANDLVSGVLTASPYNAPAQFPVGTTIVGFSATDAYGNTGFASASVTVNYQNAAPVITAPADPYALTVAEDTYAFITPTATDANGDPLTWDVYAAAANGTVAVDAYTGAISYIGNLNYNGTDAFIVRVRDPYGAFALLHVNVSITPVNDPPVITSPADLYTVSNQIGWHTFIPVTAFDVDGDTWTVNMLTPPTDGYAAVTGAGIDYYGATAVGTQQLTFNVVDAYGLPSSILGQTVFINVTGSPANPPIIIAPVDHYTTPGAAYTLNVVQDGYANFTLGVTDADVGDTASFDLYALPANGVVTVDAYGLVQYAPNAAYVGADAFTVRVTDSYGLVDLLPVNVTVNTAGSSVLTVQVQDVYANPISGVTVWAVDAYTNLYTQIGVTDAYGQAVKALTGRYYYLAADTGTQAYASGYMVQPLANGSNIDISGLPMGIDPYVNAHVILTLDAGQRFSGQVLDANGIPVPAGTLVRYSPVSSGGIQGDGFQTQTDAYGQFATGVRPGNYYLYADARLLDAYGQEVALTAGSAGGYFTATSGAVVVPSVNQAAVLTPPLTINARLQAGTQISGVVRDHYGNAVAYANVQADGYSAGASFQPTEYSVQTDAYGQYTINLPNSRAGEYYMLRVSHNMWDLATFRMIALPSGDIGGYASTLVTGDVVLAANDPYTRAFVLTGASQIADMRLVRGATLSGVVVDAYGAVARAGINMFDAQHNNFSVETDDRGYYSINVAPSALAMMVNGFIQMGSTRLPLANSSAGGYVDTYGQVSMNFPGMVHSFAQNDVRVLDILLPVGGTITGFIHDAYGNPATAVDLAVESATTQNSISTASNADGSFTINVVPGDYHLLITGGRWSNQSWPANWATGYVDVYGTLTDQYVYAQTHTITAGASRAAIVQLVTGPLYGGIPAGITTMTLTHNPYAVLSDGYSAIQVDAVVSDGQGTPQAGVTVFFSTPSPNAVLSAASAVTDAYGLASIAVTDAYAENVPVDAYSALSTMVTTTPIFLDPYADADGDGLNNADEFANGTNAFDPDTDRDGFTDLQEINAGSNPLSAFSLPTGTPVGNGAWLDFEDAYGGGLWTDGSLWQHGTASSGPVAAHSGAQLWATNLATNYPNNAFDALYLPLIDTYGMNRPTLSFYLWSSTETGFDATNLEKFDPLTGTWTRLDPYITPYDATQFTHGSAPGWGVTQGYQLVAFDLSAFVGQQVQLRYLFTSDASITAAGAYLDDIRLNDENSDPDGDGLIGIIDEYSTYGTDPMLADTDGDGINDGAEVAAGTNPLDPLSHGNRVPVAGVGMPTAGLIAYYPFDGNANDQTANANHLTISNATLVADRNGTANAAYRFDGATSSMRAVVGPELSVNAVTMAAWVKVNGNGNFSPRLFGVGPAGSSGQYYALIQTGTGIGSQLWYYGSGVTPDLTGTNTTWSDGSWHHVAVTDDGANYTIYVDGVVDTQVASTGNMVAFTSAVLQVGMSDNGLDAFNGDMDELRFYNRALSATEIQALAGTNAVAVNNHYTINQDSYASIQLTGYDPDNNPLTFTVVAPPAAGMLYQTVDGYTQGAAIVNPYTQVTDTYGRVVFVPAAGQTGQPYASFDFYASDPYSSSAPATVTVDVVFQALLTASSSLPGAMTGGIVDITAQLVDGNGTPLVNSPLQFTIPAAYSAQFTQNGLQTLDLYTDANGMAVATISDLYAETVPVTVNALNYGVAQTINQVFASNTGVGTVIASASGNSNISGANCNAVWDLYGSPYHVQNSVYIGAGCRLQIDPYVVVKFNDWTGLYVQNGGVLDVYGQTGAGVTFTSVNDDSIAGVVPGSTGAPVAGNWYGLDYQSGSAGSMAFAEVRYADHALYVRNSSPRLDNFTATEFSASGLYLQSYTNEITSPLVTNLVLNTTGTSNYPLYLLDSSNNAASVVAPTITGSSITTASTNTGYGAIYMNGQGVQPTISNMTINGGAYSLYARNGAGGTFTGNTFDGAINESIYLADASSPSIDASNTLSNSAAPYLMVGQTLPATLAAALGAGITDVYSVHLTGTFSAANTVLAADPLASGNSVWNVIGNLYVGNGARLQIDPYAVLKFNNWIGLYVQNGAVLDVYGTATQPVTFTLANDDYAGAVLPSSNGMPVAGNWYGLDYQSGSAGSMAFAEVRYASDALYVSNSSPRLDNFTATEFSNTGLYLYATTNQVTSPIVTALTLSTTANNNHPLYIYASGTGIVNPVLNGGNITTASTNSNYGAIYIDGAANPQISNFTISGGAYNLYERNGAGGTFTANTFDGATNESIYLANASPVIDASNTISNSAAPYLMVGQSLPATLTPVLGAGIVDVYSVHLTGTFSAANTVLAADPLVSGNSVWNVVGSLYVGSGARLQIDPYSVLKFNNGTGLYVQNGGVLDVYGTATQPVTFTLANDDYAGAILPSSNGMPVAGNWYGLDYQGGSAGSMAFAEVRYADHALYVRNSSPRLDHFTATEFSASGLYLRSYTNEITSPLVTNLVLNTTDTSNYPLYLLDSSNNAASVVAPTITGSSITTASTNTAYGAIYMSGQGVQPTISNMTINGGAYSLYASNGAGGTFTGNSFAGAIHESIYLANASSPTIDASNTLSNSAAAFRLVGQTLPANVSSLLASNGTGIADPYSLRISGTLAAGANERLSPDPLATGNSQWWIVSDLIVPAGASLTVDPYTVVKLSPWNTDVIVDGVLDVYGSASQPVIFTSVNDDAYGVALPSSTGTPGAQDWGDIMYRTGSSGSLRFAHMRYGWELYVNNSSPLLQDVSIFNNGSYGLHIYGSNNAYVTAPTVQNLSIAESSGIYIQSGTSMVTQPVFSGSHQITRSSNSGYGLYLAGAGVSTTLTNLTLRGFDLGVLVDLNASLTLSNSLIEGTLSNGVRLGWSSQTGAISLSNNRILNNQNGAGILVNNVPAGTVIEHNLIRGNSGQWGDYAGGIDVASSVTTNPQIRNNLIVENSATYSLGSGGISVRNGAVVSLLNNTISDNLITDATADGAGLRAIGTANVTMQDNIIAANNKNGSLNDVFSTAILSESYNLVQDGRINNGVNDVYAVPQMTGGWYLGAASPAINADPYQYLALPWLAANPYAEANTSDAGNLDLGYHHRQPTPVISATLTTVSPLNVNLGGLATAVTLTVTPKDTAGNVVGSGLQLKATLANGLSGASVVWPVRDLGDGRYEVVINAGSPAMTDTVSITVNGVLLNNTAQITW